MVKKYFNGAYEGELKIFDVLQIELQEVPFDASESRDLKKLMKIFFLGQLVGLPTLHSLLRKHGIRSNKHQINYKHLCNKLTISTIRKVFEGIFEAQILDVLKKMSEKDSSCWSRELVTALVDDSIFKQWHNQQDPSKDFEGCFGKFFSGQFMASVYGFKVVTFALSIDGIVYPLYFDYVKKATDSNPKPLTAPQVAEKLVRKWGLFVKKAQEKGISLPKLHFSCDNGYSDIPLCETCSDNSLIYISVPKKSHLFEIHQKEGAIKKMNLDNWIKDVFLDAEKKHLEGQIALPKDKKTAFTYRFRAHYLAQNREVTLLAFRLNGSKKVSVIYCTDKNIFAKTLRRHWFQRTYIEQFFKLLKHVLRIQEARIRSKNEFEIKLFRFAFVAYHAQKVVRFLRKRFKEFDNYGFITIQRTLNDDPIWFDLLHDIIKI